MIDNVAEVDLNQRDTMKRFITETFDQHLKAVKATLSVEFGKLVQHMDEHLDPIKSIVDDMSKLKIELETNPDKHRLLSKYENDSVEQYSRRDNIKISRMVEDKTSNENLCNNISAIAKDISAVITPEDIRGQATARDL